MKKHFRIFTVILVVSIMLCTIIIPASAALPSLRFGDVTYDSYVDIMDATQIQRYVAHIEEYGRHSKFAGDVDTDGELTIIDATLVQRYVANIIDEFPAGNETYVDMSADALTADYSSGKASVGVPVTFTAHASGFLAPFTYTFYVDGEEVRADSQENTFTYTFDTAGIHSVGFAAVNLAGICPTMYIDYAVSDEKTPDGELTIQSLYHLGFRHEKVTFEVISSGGKGEHQYSFALYQDSNLPTSNGVLIEETPFIEDNTFTTSQRLVDGTRYALHVTVTDVRGVIVTEVLEFEFILPPPA